MNFNRAIVIGNLTRDPEMRTIPSGQTVCNFGMATNRSWTDQSGVKQTAVEYHNIVAWRKLAEIIGQYLKKGSLVMIEGRLQTRSWQAQDGTNRYRTEIVAENMQMGPRGSGSGGDYSSSSAGESESNPTPTINVDEQGEEIADNPGKPSSTNLGEVVVEGPEEMVSENPGEPPSKIIPF